MPSASQTSERSDDTTQLLALWSRGDRDAGERVLARLYPQLRGVARRQIRGTELSLEPTELLNQAWLRVLAQRRVVWHNRSQFFALVATMVRREVVDQLRARRRLKRSGHGQRAADPLAEGTGGLDYLALDRALTRLAELDPVAARVVELRHFAGASVEETAQALEVSERTVKRRWRTACAYLRARLAGDV